MSPTINQLTEATDITDISFVGATGNITAKVTLKTITDNIKKELGYMVRVLEKCQHCGQYGAVMCACPKCGAPIDPKG